MRLTQPRTLPSLPGGRSVEQRIPTLTSILMVSSVNTFILMQCMAECMGIAAYTNCRVVGTLWRHRSVERRIRESISAAAAKGIGIVLPPDEEEQRPASPGKGGKKGGARSGRAPLAFGCTQQAHGGWVQAGAPREAKSKNGRPGAKRQAPPLLG